MCKRTLVNTYNTNVFIAQLVAIEQTLKSNVEIKVKT